MYQLFLFNAISTPVIQLVGWITSEVKKYWPDGFPGYDHIMDPPRCFFVVVQISFCREGRCMNEVTFKTGIMCVCFLLKWGRCWVKFGMIDIFNTVIE